MPTSPPAPPGQPADQQGRLPAPPPDAAPGQPAGKSPGPSTGERLARERLRVARVGRLATVTARGDPHVVPCCFALEGEHVYTAVDGKPKRRTELRRLDNVAAHPAACLLVDHYDEEWSTLWWVRADGLARVLDPGPGSERARTLLRAKYAQYEVVSLEGPVIELRVTSWRWWP